MKSAIIKKRFPISVSGIDANTSIITLTLTNLIPFSAHSSNFLKIDIAWHLSFTEIISFSNTLKELILFFLSLGLKKRMLLLKEL